MLNAETKQRIQNARNVLVGKVPDPKSQVEQITLALMYRYMDSIDRESEDLGGAARFFANGYERFAWGKVMDPRLGGRDRQDLYREAIEEMSNNPHLPQLFRDIFRGAYLPYRDEETLRLFLSEINALPLEHTEDLGDAYEHLLSILSSQGDAGQFRTPRHIIDFIVKVVDPKKGDTVLDPACGTAGFLIHAYQHVLDANTDARPGDRLTGDERARLMKQFAGYDIDPGMVRLAQVNMYLHGFPSPDIHEYDTLGSEVRWDDTFDVILANPPFMTPKGGIRPHKRFSVQANRSEVLFVDYIAEHLNPAGRAGVIVPEGIIFQSSNAYKRLRKMLVEDGYLWAVVSLPAGVFNPYAGVKTSILFLDREIAKRSDSILFVKVENDGFDLGAQRRPIEANDLPAALEVLRANRQMLPSQTHATKPQASALPVQRRDIVNGGEYSLTADRYRPASRQAGTAQWPLVPFADVCTLEYGISLPERARTPGPYPVVGSNGIAGWHNDFLVDAPAIVVGRKGSAGEVSWISNPCTPIDTTYFIKTTGKHPILLPYLYRVLRRLDLPALRNGGGVPGLNRNDVYQARSIPLPPLEVQQQIVDEIEGYQKVIDGARQVVENWRPWFRIDPAWPTVELGEVCNQDRKAADLADPEAANLPYVGLEQVESQSGDVAPLAPSEAAQAVTGLSFLFDERHVLYGKLRPYLNKVAMPAFAGRCSTELIPLLPTGANRAFLAYLLRSPQMVEAAMNGRTGSRMPRADMAALLKHPVAVPPLEIQQQIVEGIEAERQAVAASRELIAAMDARIAARVDEVWGDPAVGSSAVQ